MFPRLREQIGTALDLFVEFSTLGEYRLGLDGLGAAGAPADAPGQAPQLGGSGFPAPGAAARTVAGGAAGRVPVATPAARRQLRDAERRGARPLRQSAERRSARPLRRRPGAPAAGEQLCLAV